MGTTTTGSWGGKLPDLEVGGEIGKGIICCHLGKVASISEDVFGCDILLAKALASTGPAVSVIPMIGTDGGEDGVNEVVDGQKGTEVDHGGASWCFRLIERTSFSTGVPSRANSSC